MVFVHKEEPGSQVFLGALLGLLVLGLLVGLDPYQRHTTQLCAVAALFQLCLSLLVGYVLLNKVRVSRSPTHAVIGDCRPLLSM